MPFLPTDTECNGLFPSICGNKMHPTMNYNFLCTGCIPRPYGKCLSDLIIPGLCDTSCDKEEPQGEPSLHASIDFYNDPTQVGEALYIHYTVTNDGEVPVENVVATLPDNEIELGTLDPGDYFTGASIYTLTAEDVTRGYADAYVVAVGTYQGRTITYDVERKYYID